MISQELEINRIGLNKFVFDLKNPFSRLGLLQKFIEFVPFHKRFICLQKSMNQQKISVFINQKFNKQGHFTLFCLLLWTFMLCFHVYCIFKRTIDRETPLYEQKEKKNSLEITVF